MSCIIQRVIQINDTVSTALVKVTDKHGNDVSATCQWSWSLDSVCWTTWSSYNTYLGAYSHIDGDYYLRILIGGFELGQVIVNGFITDCYSITLYNQNPFLESLCGNPNMFNPYANLDCALLLQQQLSDSIICMLGIPVYYFRVSPNEDTADYSFKEWVLHHVESVKSLKIMVEDGELPSSNPQMSDFDFDWEREWTVEISKTAFATAFGDTAYPKNLDFLYIPMMKRMYTVNSAYDEKKDKLMWRSTTWSLMLQKYNENTNISQEEFSDIIDSFIVNNYEDVFGSKERVEQERVSGTVQDASPKFAANNLMNVCLSDAVREYFDPMEIKSIAQEQINHGSNVVARNIYKFGSTSESNGHIIYQNRYCGDSGTMSFIIRTRPFSSPFQTLLVSINDITLKYSQSASEAKKLTCMDNSVELEDNKTYLVIFTWDRKTWNVSLEAYEHKLTDTNAPYWLRRPDMWKFVPYKSVSFPYPGELFVTKEKTVVDVHPIFCDFTNFKLYEQPLHGKASLEEAIKYTTTNKNCVINDLARPLEGPLGYEVR